ncbi:MAG: transcriptional regulator [Candidatus Pristimantibacillus sp.]
MASLELGDSRLSEFLKKKNITQAEFARRIGVKRQFIYQVIHKERRFSLEQGILASYILECDVSDLYYHTYIPDNRSE